MNHHSILTAVTRQALDATMWEIETVVHPDDRKGKSWEEINKEVFSGWFDFIADKVFSYDVPDKAKLPACPKCGQNTLNESFADWAIKKGIKFYCSNEECKENFKELPSEVKPQIDTTGIPTKPEGAPEPPKVDEDALHAETVKSVKHLWDIHFKERKSEFELHATASIGRKVVMVKPDEFFKKISDSKVVATATLRTLDKRLFKQMNINKEAESDNDFHPTDVLKIKDKSK